MSVGGTDEGRGEVALGAAGTGLPGRPEHIFAFSAQERHTLVLPAVLFLVAVPFGLLSGFGVTPVTVGGGIVCDLALFLVLWTRRHAATAVGAAGLSIRRGPWRWRTWAWSEIADIEVRSVSHPRGTAMARSGSTWYVRVTPERGHPFHLPALSRSMGRPNPDFDTDCDQIIDCWERYA